MSSVIKFWIALICLSVTGTAWADYPLAQVKNNTDYTIIGEVQYLSAFCSDDSYSVAPGKTWRAKSRGVCLIDKITGSAVQGSFPLILPAESKHGERTNIVPYTSSGTSYSKFQITAYGDQYRIFSEAEHKRVSKTDAMSPGFKLVNKTDWPIAYSMDQVGCLYYDVVPSRWQGKDGVRVVDTGAVWFTLHFNIQPDGISPINEFEDCALPVIEITGAVLLGVAETVLTGSPKASAGIAAKVVAKQAVKTAINISVKEISKTMASQLQNYMNEAGAVTMYGQYAGYDWPFRCDKMPEYHITGGPEVLRDEEGGVYLKEGSELKVTKVNSCGNDMMLGSKTSATASTDLPFPTHVQNTIDGFTGNSGSGGQGGSTGTVTPPPTSSSHNGALKSGLGTCLDAAGSYPKAGSNVSSWTCHGGKNQSWKFQGKKLVNGSGLCLDIEGGKSNLIVWSCHGGANQQWTLSGGRLKNVNGKCVDIAGESAKAGTNVMVYNCHSGKNQQWNHKTSGRTVAPPTPPTRPSVNQEQACYNLIQGKVAWDQSGNKKWADSNVKNLCKGTVNPAATRDCFKRGIAQGKGWSVATQSCKSNTSSFSGGSTSNPAPTVTGNSNGSGNMACACTGSACGSGGIGGNQGDVFSHISPAKVKSKFESGSGWTCAVPSKISGSNGPLACFCNGYCGNGGIGANPKTFRLGVSESSLNEYYGGGKKGNPTGWVCGNYRGKF